MTGFPLHVLGLVAFFLWLRWRPSYPLKYLVPFWWGGLLLMHLAPSVLLRTVWSGREAQPGPLVGLALGLMIWIGSVLFLRALGELILRERTWNRRTRVWAGLFVLWLLVGPVLPRALGYVATLLALPFLLSFRWRAAMGALNLLLLNVTALLTIFLFSAKVSDPWAAAATVAKGLIMLSAAGQRVGIIFAFFVIPATATRIHLQIRRIAPRLISSHLLAAIVPAGLLVLFLLLGTTLYLSTYRGALAVRMFTEQSQQAVQRIAEALEVGEEVSENPFGESAGPAILLRREGDDPVRVVAGAPAFEVDSLLAVDAPSDRAPLLFDGQTLFLRARLDRTLGARPVRIEALAPVDSSLTDAFSRIVGVPVAVHPRATVSRNRGGVSVTGDLGGMEAIETRDAARSAPVSPSPSPAVGRAAPPASEAASSLDGPSGRGSRRLPGGATVDCLKRVDGRWQTTPIIISSSAGFGEQILSLFAISRDNPMATVVLFVLGIIAVLLLGAIWVVASMVVDMVRSVTRAVGALSTATDALREGKLDYRAQIGGQDELWAVASSFNTMADGLQRMRAMELESERLEEELRLARAIQDRLLPALPPVLERAELAGTSLPAREVGGDYYDYLVLEGGLVGIAVADVSGKGAAAAMLMSTFRASLRSQDLLRLGPAEVLARINQFIHASVDPGKFITAFLGLLDPSTGEFRYANAGHDAPIVIGPDGSAGELTGGGLILGMLPQFVYEEASAQLAPGSLVAIFTDGITEARDPNGEFFGTDGLLAALKGSQNVPCDNLVHRVVDSIREFSAAGPQSDDITLVLVRRS